MVFSQNRSKKNNSNATASLELKVFPNPATNYIGINGDVTSVKTLKVFNLVGKEMKKFEVSEGSNYYIGDLAKGMYLVQITDKRGKNITTQRVSKR